MSMNGITGYNAYSYSNPYAINNTYNNANTTAFQGGDTTTFTTAQEKDEGINPLLVIGGALAAAGTVAYAIKRGKTINLANLTDDAAKQADNLKGLKGVWNNLKIGTKSIFTKAGREASNAASQNNAINEVLKQLGEDASKIDADNLKTIIEKQVKTANPEATAEDVAKVVEQYIKKSGDKTTVITNGLEELLQGYKAKNTNGIKNFFSASQLKSTTENAAKAAGKATSENTVQTSTVQNRIQGIKDDLTKKIDAANDELSKARDAQDKKEIQEAISGYKKQLEEINLAEDAAYWDASFDT